ncbi:DNA-formamidopyrimidine glycosylase [Gloeocapsopsis dulcis]|uniref:Formamidopyrimidine-DNA glycosylase n=1 Tax=Gloeocapsopsis dulcis AAB1 = 1H9 TaxID=1433147 RepID=A0A6N8G1B9_9CHRO|nr:DNA-formamidopyrimidine glycosylase [Gloeocapsopsis dulcis]MUL38375.1 DNA-formamidopyrimidine glycosylase [Gloeocapsopsis dulcis AAB1 = 1H9]WNN91582.1 DNA-formamidopyrimidine glycosylase [Gloeocapsopsis dulcis]
MPELPEVETVRRGLNQMTLNQEIMGGDVLLERTIAHPISAADFLTGTRGCAIAQWHRYGKYLLAELVEYSTKATSGWLGVHLRMTGQLLWLNQHEDLHKHTRIRLFFAHGLELRFVDQRTFGQMWWVPPGTPPESIMTGIARLGLDPFSLQFSIKYLAQKLKKRHRAIKTALLDQTIVAGLGNIYADEALFLSKLRPTTLCSELRLPQIELLHRAIIQVLETSLAAGGTTFSTFLNVQGINGKYSGIAWVYNRTGQPCRICQTPIQRIRLTGRSSHFCPNCQQ